MSTEAKFDALDAMPRDTPDFMVGAWLSCLQWAIGVDDIRASFEQETGMRFVRARTPIDSMIDEATGIHEAYIRQFVEWFNVNIWGSSVSK